MFVFEVLVRCDPSYLTVFEQIFMDMLDVVNTGYNHAPKAGNCLGVKHSAATIAKVRAASTGRHHSVETREALSQMKKGKPLSAAHRAALRVPKSDTSKVREAKLGENNPNFGKPRSEETKRRIAEAQKGKKRRKATPDEVERRRKGLLIAWARRKAPQRVE